MLVILSTSRFLQSESWGYLPEANSPLPLISFLDAVPTAELEPITDTYVQADEVWLSLHRRPSDADPVSRRTWA